MPDELLVEVFPVKVDRWVAVIATPDGDLSTEASSAQAVDAEVAVAVRAVLGEPTRRYRLVDGTGAAWTLAVAMRQASALHDGQPGGER